MRICLAAVPVIAAIVALAAYYYVIRLGKAELPAGPVIIESWGMSPDGTKIALDLVHEIDDVHYLALASITRGKSTRFRPVIVKHAEGAVWSPDGALIAYSSITGRDEEERLAVCSLSNGRRRYLTAGYVDMPAIWDSTGSALVFVRLDFSKPACLCQLYAIPRKRNTFGSAEALGVSGTVITSLSWRPSRREIAYLASSRDDPANFRLNLLDVGTNRVRAITPPQGICGYDWSPDGNRVIYETSDAGIFRSLEVLDLTTGSRRTLIRKQDLNRGENVAVRGICWSPDGKTIAFDVCSWPPGISILDLPADGGTNDIAILELPSGKLNWLTSDGRSRLPGWSRNAAKEIIYIHGSSEVRSIRIDNKQNRRIFGTTQLQ